MRHILKFKAVSFVVKFLLLLAAFYMFNLLFIGITAGGGKFYSPFLDHHLNYIHGLRSALLHSSSLITHVFGLNSWVKEPYVIRSQSASVVIVYSCIGYLVMSFWLAFVIASEEKWEKKLFWALGGVLGIFLINCFRVSLLLLATQHKWSVNKFVDHHTLFNILSYALVIVMMLIFSKKGKEQQSKVET